MNADFKVSILISVNPRNLCHPRYVRFFWERGFSGCEHTPMNADFKIRSAKIRWIGGIRVVLGTWHPELLFPPY
jgi:hypothetical protein